MISHWWFRDQLTLLIIPWRTLLVSPIFPCGTLQFHATLFLSFLTMVSFLTTTSLSTTALGPLLDAPDRCVGFLAWSCWEGDRTVRQEIASFPPRCATTPFGSSPPTTLILNSWSSKSLVKEGVTYYLCCLSYYCRSTTSSTPYYFLKPWTMVNKNRYWAVSLFEAALPFFVVIGSINMRRRLSRVSHMTHPHHGTVPSCLCIVQNTTRTRIPTWSSAGTSYF